MEKKKNRIENGLSLVSSHVKQFTDFISNFNDGDVLVILFYQTIKANHVIKNEHRDIEVKNIWRTYNMKHPLLRVEVNDLDFEAFIRNRYGIKEMFPVIVIINGRRIIDIVYDYGRRENLVGQVNMISCNKDRSGSLHHNMKSVNTNTAECLISHALSSSMFASFYRNEKRDHMLSHGR